MEEALKHFKKVDPILYEIAIKVKLRTWPKPEDPFVDLIESIIGQQLSGKAADTIFGRFKKLFPKEQITPERIVKLDTEKIRGAGISYGKIKYIKGIAEEVVNGKLDFGKFEHLPDEEVTTKLIKLKGVGAWTAEMFLMFTLTRPDIFSAGDLGLQNAMIRLYKLDKPKREKLLEISGKWSPYRSLASRILWASLELK